MATRDDTRPTATVIPFPVLMQRAAPCDRPARRVPPTAAELHRMMARARWEA